MWPSVSSVLGTWVFLLEKAKRSFLRMLQIPPPPLLTPPALCPGKLSGIRGLPHPPTWIQPVRDQSGVWRWEDSEVREFILLLPSLKNQHYLQWLKVTAIVRHPLHTALSGSGFLSIAPSPLQTSGADTPLLLTMRYCSSPSDFSIPRPHLYKQSLY